MDWWQLSAIEIVRRLKTTEVTPFQLIDCIESRLKEVDCVLNAVTIQCFELARQKAEALVHPEFPPPGYLYGLPIVVKDSMMVKGVRYTMVGLLALLKEAVPADSALTCFAQHKAETFIWQSRPSSLFSACNKLEGCEWKEGSTIYNNEVADANDPAVDALERNGAIIIGTTNMPEMGAGANTYNEVFGETLNPWDKSKTCGGSSGGTAAALASGMAWLGTGTDLGGSLRIPASFCGVVGLRPSVGRVASHFTIGDPDIAVVSGPMARNVQDLALLLDAMVGAHPSDPHSLPAPNYPFQDAVKQPPGKQLCIAWSADLGGIAPVDPEVAQICHEAVQWFNSQGCLLIDDCPQIADADEIFQTLRAEGFRGLANLPDETLSKLKPELRWQIEKGQEQSRAEVQAARVKLKSYQQRVAEFFAKYDFLCTPCVMTAPFDVSTRWLKQVNGRTFTNYVEWLLMTFAFSMVDLPSISIPCGLTSSGLPVGLQMVGRHRKEYDLLSTAAWFESNHDWKYQVPCRCAY